MEFVFVPYPARGHIGPMLAVAAELVARGERVRMVTGARYAGAIAQAGVLPVLSSVDHDVRVPAGWRPRELMEHAGLGRERRSVSRALALLTEAEIRTDRPDVLVVDPHVRWAGALGERLSIGTVRFWTTHARSATGSGPALINAIPELQPGLARFGPRFHFVGPLVGALSLTDPGLPWRRLEESRVLVVSPGTVFARRREFFLRIVREFARSPWFVVIATGHLSVDALGVLPDNIVAHQWIPQLRVLQHADVFLTHGGMNSVQEAMVSGVPMLLSPRIREQRLTARRVVNLSLGTWLSRTKPLRDQVELLSQRSPADQRLRTVGLMSGTIYAADKLLRLADEGVAR